MNNTKCLEVTFYNSYVQPQSFYINVDKILSSIEVQELVTNEVFIIMESLENPIVDEMSFDEYCSFYQNITILTKEVFLNE